MKEEKMRKVGYFLLILVFVVNSLSYEWEPDCIFLKDLLTKKDVTAKEKEKVKDYYQRATCFLDEAEKILDDASKNKDFLTMKKFLEKIKQNREKEDAERFKMNEEEAIKLIEECSDVFKKIVEKMEKYDIFYYECSPGFMKIGSNKGPLEGYGYKWPYYPFMLVRIGSKNITGHGYNVIFTEEDDSVCYWNITLEDGKIVRTIFLKPIRGDRFLSVWQDQEVGFIEDKEVLENINEKQLCKLLAWVGIDPPSYYINWSKDGKINIEKGIMKLQKDIDSDGWYIECE